MKHIFSYFFNRFANDGLLIKTLGFFLIVI